MISVLVADDHKLFRQGVVRLIADSPHLKVVAEAGTCSEAIDVVRARSIDLAIIDIEMPGRGGIDLVARIRDLTKTVRILVVTMFDEESQVTRAMRAGADGYLTKEHAADELHRAIGRVMRGEKYLCSSVAERVALGMVAGHQNDLPHTRLSEREFKVFELLVAGKRGREIADAMNLSQKTVSTHKAHVLRKMNLTNGTELVLYALRNQLVKEQ